MNELTFIKVSDTETKVRVENDHASFEFGTLMHFPTGTSFEIGDSVKSIGLSRMCEIIDFCNARVS